VTQDSFSLDGWTYYSQIRKCGKDGCKCAAGEPHGPYWYRRNRRSGEIEYVGKELPDGVGEAHFALSVQRAEVMATRRRDLRRMFTHWPDGRVTDGGNQDADPSGIALDDIVFMVAYGDPSPRAGRRPVPMQASVRLLGWSSPALYEADRSLAGRAVATEESVTALLHIGQGDAKCNTSGITHPVRLRYVVGRVDLTIAVIEAGSGPRFLSFLV
jgi:hypothetical protein